MRPVEFCLCMDDGTWTTAVIEVPSGLHALYAASGNPDPLIVYVNARGNLSRKVACVFLYNGCPEESEHASNA